MQVWMLAAYTKVQIGWLGKSILIFFVLLFVAIVAWALTRSQKEVDDNARIPLEDDPVHPRDVGARDQPRKDDDEE